LAQVPFGQLAEIQQKLGARKMSSIIRTTDQDGNENKTKSNRPGNDTFFKRNGINDNISSEEQKHHQDKRDKRLIPNKEKPHRKNKNRYS